jgi:peptidoglycan/LPS O-acetylase OafA/YrhL
MNTLWTVITIGAVVVILAAVLWTFVVAPFRIPRHSVKP